MKKKPGAVVTIGTFDGLHRGHQKIFKKVRQLACRFGSSALAVTFNVPPRLFFFPSKEPSLLTTVEEKIALLKSFGIENVVLLKFGPAFSKMSARSFFDRFIIGKWNAKAVVVGYNFGFGKKREGDARYLEHLGQACGVPVTVVPPVCEGNVPVSSGRIRDSLRQGNLGEANHLLGYPYFVTGKVVRGEGLGRNLGYPTANLEVSKDKILPEGIYAVRVSILRPNSGARSPFFTLRSLCGMCSIGVRPTIAPSGRKKEKLMEVHLFNFKGNLYRRTLKVELLKRTRPEKKFPTLKALKNQLDKDKSEISCFLTEENTGQ